MSVFVAFSVDNRLPKREAKALAARLTTETGFALFAAAGWFARSTDCLVTTDSGDIFEDTSDGLVPAPGAASQIQAVVTVLLELSSTVAVSAGWMGVVKENVPVDFDDFIGFLHKGELAESVRYQVRRR